MYLLICLSTGFIWCVATVKWTHLGGDIWCIGASRVVCCDIRYFAFENIYSILLYYTKRINSSVTWIMSVWTILCVENSPFVYFKCVTPIYSNHANVKSVGTGDRLLKEKHVLQIIIANLQLLKLYTKNSKTVLTFFCTYIVAKYIFLFPHVHVWYSLCILFINSCLFMEQLYCSRIQ